MILRMIRLPLLLVQLIAVKNNASRVIKKKNPTGAPVGFFFLITLLISLTTSQRSLRRRQSCYRHAVGRATDVVEADHVAELDAVGVAAVFAADAHFQVRVGGAAFLYRHTHELAYAFAVERLEGVGGENLDLLCGSWFVQTFDVAQQELAFGVVAANAKGGLRQVVGAKAEEVSHR